MSRDLKTRAASFMNVFSSSLFFGNKNLEVRTSFSMMGMVIVRGA